MMRTFQRGLLSSRFHLSTFALTVTHI
uniref:Uncharacterized protein n=1 Tax=Arundo donax TaxID=35708 RepID=A0A0A8XNW0_ARUDO